MVKQEIIYGIHAAKAAIVKHYDKVNHAYILDGKHDRNLNDTLKLIKKHNIKFTRVDKGSLSQMAGNTNHQGIVLQVSSSGHYDFHSLLDTIEALEPGEKLKLLVLDEVQDPHNLGACLRSADAFGVHAIIVPKNNAAHLTPVVRKVACGAAEVVPTIVVTNLVRALRELQELNFWVVGTAADAEDTLSDVDSKQNLVMVLGAEGTGMRRLTKDVCDQLISIPMTGSVSSLNVSVSAGVILYHLSMD